MKHTLFIGCAAAALIAAPGHAQTTTGTPSQQAGSEAVVQDQSSSANPAGGAEGTQDQANSANPAGGAVQTRQEGEARVEERDVVVTGSRFQRILDQPQSKSVINAEDRNLSGVGNIRQLIQVQPGFNYSDAFGVNVRGVGRQTAQTLLGQENAVLQYVDGFLNLVPSNVAESTLFGGNVQFIRGPSGTTGGRNSLAGSMNLLSRFPTKEFTAQAVVGVGRANFTNLGANISGPITGNLAFRFGLETFVTPTIFRNLSGRTLDSKRPGSAGKNRYFEFQLEWSPGPFHIRNRLTTFTYDSQPGGSPQVRYNSNLVATGTPASVFGGLGPNPQFGFAGPTPDEAYEINVNYAGYDRLRRNLQNITNADLDLGFASLVYVGGYQQYVAQGSADLDGTPRLGYTVGPVNAADYFPATNTGGTLQVPTNFFAPGTFVPTDYRSNYDNDNFFYTQEGRLESKPNSGPVSWVLGFYYFNQDFDESYWESIENATDAILNPIVGTVGLYPAGTLPPPNPRRATYEQRNIYQIRSTATFGNVTWDITDNIRFDGGLRYTWDEKNAVTKFRYVYYYPPVFASDVSPLINGANTFRRDQGLSGRAALAYRAGPGNQIYITYQRGYQASAFTLGQGLPGPDPANPRNIAEPMNLDVYELGGFFTRGRIRFDGSVFYQNFFNQQIPISNRGTITSTNPTTGETTTAPGPIFTEFTNAPLSRIWGTEAQVTWRPNDRSNIVASYTYLNPTFRRFTGPIDISEPCSVTPLTGGQQCTNAAGANYIAPTNPLYQTQQNLAGREIPRTPRHKATLYGYYAIDLGSFGSLYPGGNVSYQSSQYANAFNNERFKIPGRTIAGVNLTYRSAGEHLDITGSVTNVFRNLYADSRSVTAFANGIVNTVTSFGADRFWTVTARYRF